MNSVFAEANRNGDWKDVVATGKNTQIIFVNISEETNPRNELEVEAYPHDYLVYIVAGSAKVTMENGKKELMQEGDLILVPGGSKINILNLNKTAPLKAVNIYSHPLIPEGTRYRTIEDEVKNTPT